MTEQGWFYLIAGDNDAADFVKDIQPQLPDGQWQALSDPAQQHERRVLLLAGKLECVMMLHREERFLNRQWLQERFADEQISATDRMSLLAGRPAQHVDNGNIVCSCFQVGSKQIEHALRDGHTTVAALGQHLRCGTNCGSCIPELKALLQQARCEVAL